MKYVGGMENGLEVPTTIAVMRLDLLTVNYHTPGRTVSETYALREHLVKFGQPTVKCYAWIGMTTEEFLEAAKQVFAKC